MLKRMILCAALVFCSIFPVLAESVQNSPNLDIIDTPTTNSLLRGMYNFHMRFYEGGGLNTRAWVGFANILMIGASFDVQNAIGVGNVNGREPKVLAKIRIIEDNSAFPSLAFGYEPQTNGAVTIPLGVYAVVSKNFFGNLLVSGGINNHNKFTDFNLTNDLGVFANAAWLIGQDFSILCEFNDILQDGSRSLNAGFRYAFAPELRIEFDFKGLTKTSDQYIRNLRIDYVNYF